MHASTPPATPTTDSGRRIDNLDITPPPTRFPINVVMERRKVRGNRWVTDSWRAVGVTVGNGGTPSEQTSAGPGANGDAEQGPAPRCPVPIIEGPDAAQYLWPGLCVELFIDEAESYYHNLMVGTPGCYIVTRPDPDGMARPVIVSLSFDAGQAYLEGDETVHAVPLPPELYRAAEAFVLAYYVPEKKKKRKRQDWKDQAQGQRHA
jgi:hypothetical protein